MSKEISDQYQLGDKQALLGKIRKTADIKKTLEALCIKVYRGVWERLGQGRKTRI